MGCKVLGKRLSKRKKKWIERTVANDRSYKLLLYNRFFLYLLLVLAQIAGYIELWHLFIYETKVGVAVQFAIGILSWIVALYLVNKVDRPATRWGWIIVILIAPVFGLPAYLLYGGGRRCVCHYSS